MNKKLIALILVLPMALMMTLFTVVKGVSLKVNIPVSKVEYLGEKFVNLDLDKGERYRVDYAVYPTGAINKGVDFSYEQVGTKPKAELEERDGYIYPKSEGVVNVVLTTRDGGHKDQFQVVVKAGLKEIICSVEKSDLKIDETVQIQTEFLPSTTNNKALIYSSSDSSVASVSETGLITAKGKGQAEITVKSLANENIFDTISVNVSVEEGLSVTSQINVYGTEGSIDLYVETSLNTEPKYEILVDEEEKDLFSGVLERGGEDGKYKFSYIFSEEFYGDVVIKFTLETSEGTLEKTCKIIRLKSLNAEFKSEEPVYVEFDVANGDGGLNWAEHIDINPATEVTYSVEYDNNNIEVASKYFPNMAKINALGLTEATITVTSKEDSSKYATLVKTVIVYPENINITESLNIYGIEKIWTIGKFDASGNEIKSKLGIKFGVENEEYKKYKGENFDILESLVHFETNNSKVAVSSRGEIRILDSAFNDIVEINLKLTGREQTFSSIKVRCVGEGREVDNFIDLYNVVDSGRPVVLQGDVIKDFGSFYNSGNVQKIKSTYDTRYYTNIGLPEPEVITLLQFRNDLYGNGFTISAENVTKVEERSKALFNGPLNFVAMGEAASSNSSLASVKGQDNICFAVFEKVKINNVTLKGYSDVDDLTDLDYAGTVVEVLGDGATLEYCRINNGRTVLRAFGDINNSENVIHVSVKNCILSSAREFIVRIGSNAFVSSPEMDVSSFEAPYLKGNRDISFPAQQNYLDKTLAEKESYDGDYIKTFLNIENSVLEDSGIFSIAIDSHFSGPMLQNGPSVLPAFSEPLKYWKGMASTSYGAKLTFSGDVRIYDWKEIDNVDSSTLIEMGQGLLESLKLDVKEMINALGDTSIICAEGEKQYVHGGIVFFGGGRNYGVFENKGESFKGIYENIDFENYKISLAEVGKDILEEAAGDLPFYFTLYDAETKKEFGFGPLQQEYILNSGSAYDCIYFR